jgi:hypothetical protein
MKKLILLLCFAASLAQASPVYLDCIMTTGNKPGTEDYRAVLWNVSVDEDNGVVSYTIRDQGISAKYKAFFTPYKVSFSIMEIDRQTLKFTRTIFPGYTDVGQCRLATKPNRQF